MKEGIKDIMAKKEKFTNWITKEEAENIAKEMIDELSDVDIRVNEEYFIVYVKGIDVHINLPRWKKIAISRNDNVIIGHIDIKNAIRRAVKTIKNGDVDKDVKN